MKLLRSVLPMIVFALLMHKAVYAQDVNWVAVLQATGSGQCLPLQSATYQGQPADLSKGAGLSMEICPWVYYDSSNYGYITAQVPPDQPWNPYPYWYSWAPTLGNTQRGTPQATNSIWYFSETDTFDYLYNLTFYTVWPQQWHGVLNRTLLLQEKCGRFPCKNYVPYPSVCGQPHNIYNCYATFKDVSATLTLTGTFPVPTH